MEDPALVVGDNTHTPNNCNTVICGDQLSSPTSPLAPSSAPLRHNEHADQTPHTLSSAFESSTFDRSLSIAVDDKIGAASISPSGRDIELASKNGLRITDLDSSYSPPEPIYVTNQIILRAGQSVLIGTPESWPVQVTPLGDDVFDFAAPPLITTEGSLCVTRTVDNELWSPAPFRISVRNNCVVRSTLPLTAAFAEGWHNIPAELRLTIIGWCVRARGGRRRQDDRLQLKDVCGRPEGNPSFFEQAVLHLLACGPDVGTFALSEFYALNTFLIRYPQPTYKAVDNIYLLPYKPPKAVGPLLPPKSVRGLIRRVDFDGCISPDSFQHQRAFPDRMQHLQDFASAPGFVNLTFVNVHISWKVDGCHQRCKEKFLDAFRATFSAIWPPKKDSTSPQRIQLPFPVSVSFSSVIPPSRREINVHSDGTYVWTRFDSCHWVKLLAHPRFHSHPRYLKDLEQQQELKDEIHSEILFEGWLAGRALAAMQAPCS